MALTDLATVKTHLGISDSSEDSLLTALVNGADTAIKTYLRRNIESQSITNEFYDGTGTRIIFLREFPVTNVSDVRVDDAGYAGKGSGAFDSDSQLTEGEDYFARLEEETERNRGELVRINKNWNQGIGNIRVDYTAGYSEVPKDIELAANQLVSKLRSGRDVGELLKSERLGSYAYTVLQSASELGTVRSFLKQYRRKVI